LFFTTKGYTITEVGNAWRKILKTKCNYQKDLTWKIQQDILSERKKSLLVCNSLKNSVSGIHKIRHKHFIPIFVLITLKGLLQLIQKLHNFSTKLNACILLEGLMSISFMYLHIYQITRWWSHHRNC